MGYALFGLGFFVIFLLFATYLEYNTRAELERVQKGRRASPRPRRVY